jgi:hypothetical protein
MQMRVFISWSGERSENIAKTLRDWLPNVIQALEPWMSASDIEQGTRWSTEIAAQLQESRVGIICLTPENLKEPWILFESGALSKTLDKTYVCTYLVGLEPADLSWPLAMFQATKADEQSTRKLLHTINSALEKHALPETRLNDIFNVWWPKLAEKLAALPQVRTSTKPQRDERTLLEEVINLSRTQAEVSQQTNRMIIRLSAQLSLYPSSPLSSYPALPPSYLEPVPEEQEGFFDRALQQMRYRDESGEYILVSPFARATGDTSQFQFEWQGCSPRPGQRWKYTKEQLDEFLSSGRIVMANNRPRFKRYMEKRRLSPRSATLPPSA